MSKKAKRQTGTKKPQQDALSKIILATAIIELIIKLIA